jgi:hypothetical protein
MLLASVYLRKQIVSKNARGKTVCSDGQTAAASNPNNGQGCGRPEESKWGDDDSDQQHWRYSQDQERNRRSSRPQWYDLRRDQEQCRLQTEMKLQLLGGPRPTIADTTHV